jgi:hypothetical protein
MTDAAPPPDRRGVGFVDLFYAVVVGGSFNLIADVTDYWNVAAKIFLIIVVLEDWFAYYTFVIPNIVETQRYKLYSLIMEFAILMSWYLSVASLNSGISVRHHLFFWISVFFVIRFITGFRAHWIRATLYSRESFSEFLYLMQSAFYFVLGLACSFGQFSFWGAFGCFVLIWVSVTIIWWHIRYPEFLLRT